METVFDTFILFAPILQKGRIMRRAQRFHISSTLDASMTIVLSPSSSYLFFGVFFYSRPFLFAQLLIPMLRIPNLSYC